MPYGESDVQLNYIIFSFTLHSDNAKMTAMNREYAALISSLKKTIESGNFSTSAQPHQRRVLRIGS